MIDLFFEEDDDDEDLLVEISSLLVAVAVEGSARDR